MAAHQLNLKSYLLLRTSIEGTIPTGQQAVEGNLLFSRLIGTNIRYFTPTERNSAGGNDKILEKAKNDIIQQKGGNPYVIPIGASKYARIFFAIFFSEKIHC
jgi:1-aminocyclopropane-1-carboxylate deaminase/D-cysteine desulfhydrase-like pyridoxal-dependent ACC family enzyme